MFSPLLKAVCFGKEGLSWEARLCGQNPSDRLTSSVRNSDTICCLKIKENILVTLSIEYHQEYCYYRLF